MVLTPGYNGDGGTIFSQMTYGGGEDPKDPVPPPMVAVTPEQYNRAEWSVWCSTEPFRS